MTRNAPGARSVKRSAQGMQLTGTSPRTKEPTRDRLPEQRTDRQRSKPRQPLKSIWKNVRCAVFVAHFVRQSPSNIRSFPQKPERSSQLLTRLPVSYTHLRAHETGRNLVCRLLLEKK